MTEWVPTRGVLDRLADEHDATWQDLVAQLDHPAHRYSDPGRYGNRPGTERVITKDFECLVSPGHWEGREAWYVNKIYARVVGTDSRPVVGVSSQKPLARRRGGSGNLWPSDFRDLLKRIAATPGTRIEHAGSGHYKIYLDEDWISTIPKTASDRRSLQNCCLALARNGLDVRRSA